MTALIAYIVCDRCGHLWPVAANAPDPVECRRCDHGAMWRFTDRHKATVQAYAVRRTASGRAQGE